MPTVLVVGLHGWILSPGLIVICDMFVYSEFLLHPVILLTTSTKLRTEIAANIRDKQMVDTSIPPLLLCKMYHTMI